ncbi:MAG: hypothetical protein ACHQHN_06055 [Sphingobacteriales bacterium]
MPTIIVGDYELEIISNPGEPPFDRFYGEEDVYLYSSILLQTYSANDLLQTVLISSVGGGTTVHETSFIVKKDRVTICCSDSVFCLSIPNLELLWRTKADSATCFEIFSHQEDYIVHGELEISRLDLNGKILWQRSGADIFITIHASPDDFIVADGLILATDWDGRKYQWDLDGNPVS